MYCCSSAVVQSQSYSVHGGGRTEQSKAGCGGELGTGRTDIGASGIQIDI